MTVQDERLDDYLAHYGVLGMKWGVRKKEPRTPKVISAEKQAKRNKRAQKFVKEANTIQSQIDKIKAKPATNWYTKSNQAKVLKDLGKMKTKALENAQRKREGKLSTTEKKLVIGGAIVAGLIAAGAVHKGIESGDIRRLTEKASNALQGKDIEWAKKAGLDDVDMSVDDIAQKVVKDINPDYGKIGTKMNCRRATMAYEMRRRGYDVMATRTTEGNGQTAAGLLNVITPTGKTRPMSNFAQAKQVMKENQKMLDGRTDTPTLNLIRRFGAGAKNAVIPKGGEQSPENMARSIFEHLAKEPNRSRGELGVQWTMGGGHSVAYELINGAPVIFDNQNGKIYKSAEDMLKAGLQIETAGWTRLDNIKLNDDFLLKWVKNV